MFGKLASDVLGISDIGKIISPSDFNKTDSDDYVMHEENEKIYFLIKSKTDEYCFTDRALIHLDGTSAMSKKRMLYRYPYYKYRFRHVHLETAGTMDLDVEIKFHLNDKGFSVDVDKKQIEQLKDLYKALLKIAEIQAENAVHEEMAKHTLELSVNALGRVAKAEIQMDEQAKKLNDYAWNWLTSARKTYVQKDFSAIFDKFINN
jgi:hypothetical protein